MNKVALFITHRALPGRRTHHDMIDRGQQYV
jgi:hypothetical protein